MWNIHWKICLKSICHSSVRREGIQISRIACKRNVHQFDGKTKKYMYILPRATEAVPIAYSKIRFHPITKPTISPTVT